MSEEEKRQVPEDEMVAICVAWWQVYKMAGKRNVKDAETVIDDDGHACLRFGMSWQGHSAEFAVNVSRHKDGWFVDSVDVGVTPVKPGEPAYADKWLTLTGLGTFAAQMRRYDKEHAQKCA